MEDISIKLLEQIQKEFEEEFTKSRKLESIYKKIFDGKADYREAHEFAQEIGGMLQGILEKHLKAENMPNGKIYQNIAEKILRPTLKNNYELTTDVTTAVQGIINTGRGINVQPMVPELQEDRIDGIILNTVNENRLSTDVVTIFTQGIVDSAIEANYEFAKASGLDPIPRRITMGNCCDWCKEVAGKVNPDADLYEIGFYRRHKSCRCLTLMDYGKIKESVHSKQGYKTVEEALAGEHAYLGALDKLTRQQRYDRKNAAYRAYYKNKRLQSGKTYKPRNKTGRGRDYEDAVLDAQREALKKHRLEASVHGDNIGESLRGEKLEKTVSDIEKKNKDDRIKEKIENNIRKNIIPSMDITTIVDRQNIHRDGTELYKSRLEQLKKKGKYGPSIITISDEEILELVKKYSGTGIIKLNKNMEWTGNEIILDNEKIIGYVVNDLNGKMVETTVFKIHYAKDGIHIVPDYPSKKKGRRK